MRDTTEEPPEVKKLRAKVADTQKAIDKRREYLQLDRVFTFKLTVKEFANRPLRFRKLRQAEVILVQGMMPNIPLPPEDAEDAAMLKAWNELDPKDKMLAHEAMCTALSTATKDDFGIQEFRDLEGPLVIEAFKWLMDVSGYSEQAISDLEWFRRPS